MAKLFAVEQNQQNEVRGLAMCESSFGSERFVVEMLKQEDGMLIPSFKWLGLNRLPKSWKLFVSFQLLVVACCYLSLLGSIWTDTQMKITNIVDGYGSMESLELIHHSFQYLFWFLGVFTITGALFLLSSQAEKLKRFFSVLVPLLILADIGSAWGVPHNPSFAWTMFASGLLLALSFSVMFILIQWDLWRPQKPLKREA